MSALVTLATDQTITGAKTFNSIRMKTIVRTLPQISGGNAMIVFFQHPDKQVSELGDTWRVGTSLEPNTQRCFMIAARSVGGRGPLLKFTPHGVLPLGPVVRLTPKTSDRVTCCFAICAKLRAT